MPRFKPYSYQQTKIIPLSLEQQIEEDSFEELLIRLVDQDLDLSIFRERYKNDATGAPAFDPSVLLKIVLYAYSRGMISSREIAKACEENVMFMAISADARPHFTTIADFVTRMKEEITVLFQQVLMLCDDLDLIGKHMFAIDGCKLPSNASKEWSGTKADLEKKAQKMEVAIRTILNKHAKLDKTDSDEKVEKRRQHRAEKMQRKVHRVKDWLDKNQDKPGKGGRIIQSNITDNESAKMPTSHGVIQGYNGVATVDSKHQVIVSAEAFGNSQEHDLLLPMIEKTRENFRAIEKEEADVFGNAKLVADTGYNTEENMKAIFEQGIEAYIPDNNFRKRDPRFQTAVRHRDGINPRKKVVIQKGFWFEPTDFQRDPKTGICICPNGKQMLRQSESVRIRGCKGVNYRGRVRDCRACMLRPKCIRKPTTPVRQVCFFEKDSKDTFTRKMMQRIDTARGRLLYSMRMGIVEPVFANLRANKKLDRFTLRGKAKVNIQWLLYSIVHNIGKIHRYGFAGA